MRLRRLLVPLAFVAAVAAFGSSNALAKAPPTDGGKALLTGGLLSPRGMKIGPDGMIYIAEAGSAGDIAPPTEDGGKSGFSGRISMIDPATGARVTVVDELPSNGGDEGDSVGPADVAFIGNQLYYLQTHGGAFYGFPDNPTGVYKVNDDGTIELVADIGEFNVANPIDDVTDAKQVDIEPGGNPYAMTVRDGEFLVTDGNQNQVMRITTAGVVTRLAEFHGHPVATGIATGDTGPLYVTTFGQFPFAASDGAVYRIGYPTGNITRVASGFSSMADVEIGPGGQLYALSFGDASSDPGPPWKFGSGKVLRLDAEAGTLTPIVTGFSFASSLIFSGDTAYVANNGVTIPGLNDGEIWKIENVSSIEPLPAAPPPATQPTVAPKPSTGTIAPPSTGTGAMARGANGTALLMLAAIVGLLGVVALSGGAAVARKGR